MCARVCVHVAGGKLEMLLKRKIRDRGAFLFVQ